MDLHPCGCGRAEFDRSSAVVALPGGEMGRRYAGRCAGCGGEREFEFRLPAMPPEAAPGEVRFGAGEPSELLDAGEWLWVSDSYARTVPAQPHRLPEPDRGQARTRL